MNSAIRERANATTNDLESLETSIRDVGPRRTKFPFISSIHSRRSRRQEDLPRIIAASPSPLQRQRGSQGLTAARRSRHRNSIKYKTRILAYRSSYSSISESILVYSRRTCRDGVSNPQYDTYIFQEEPPDRGKRVEERRDTPVEGNGEWTASFLLYRRVRLSLSGEY